MKKIIITLLGSAVMLAGIGCGGGGGGGSSAAAPAPTETQSSVDRIENPVNTSEIDDPTGTNGVEETLTTNPVDDTPVEEAPEAVATFDLATHDPVWGTWWLVDESTTDENGATIQPVRIVFVVRNLVPENAPGELLVSFWLSPDQAISEGDIHLTDTVFTPNQWVPYQGSQYCLFDQVLEFSNPGGLNGYSLLVRLDSLADLPELSEENNDGYFQKKIGQNSQSGITIIPPTDDFDPLPESFEDLQDLIADVAVELLPQISFQTGGTFGISDLNDNLGQINALEDREAAVSYLQHLWIQLYELGFASGNLLVLLQQLQSPGEETETGDPNGGITQDSPENNQETEEVNPGTQTGSEPTEQPGVTILVESPGSGNGISPQGEQNSGPAPDLAIDNPVMGAWQKKGTFVDENGTVQHRIRIAFLIRNLSPATPPEMIQIRLLLSQDQELGNIDDLELTTINFVPNQWFTYEGTKVCFFNQEFHFTNPGGDIIGWYMGAMLDPNGELAEISEENNNGVFQGQVDSNGYATGGDFTVVNNNQTFPNSGNWTLDQLKGAMEELLSGLSNQGWLDQNTQLPQIFALGTFQEVADYLAALWLNLYDQSYVVWYIADLALAVINEIDPAAGNE